MNPGYAKHHISLSAKPLAKTFTILEVKRSVTCLVPYAYNAKERRRRFAGQGEEIHKYFRCFERLEEACECSVERTA